MWTLTFYRKKTFVGPMRYSELETALVDIHGVPDGGRKGFRARLRVLRDMGVPCVAKPGKGAGGVEYSFDDLWETAVGLALARGGLPPLRIAIVVDAFRKLNILDEVRRKQKRLKSDMWCSALLLGFETDALTHGIVAPVIAPLERIFAELKQTEKNPDTVALLYGLINLSQLTRNCEAAISKR